MAPFVFLGAVLAAIGSLVASPTLWLAALTAALLAILCDAEQRVSAVTALSLTVWVYTAWGIANDLVNPAYTPAGVFHPLFLAAGFTLARTASGDAARRVFIVVTTGAAVLAAWALWQAATGQGRAHAHFETPNTLATVLNLALAPLLFRMIYGDVRRWEFAAGIVLLAGLLTTLSRGGFMALIGGLAVAMLLSRIRADARSFARVLIALCAGAAIGGLALSLARWLDPGALSAQAQIAGVSSTVGASMASRTELYRLALSALGQHPWLGTGYLGFQALFEAHRAAVPSYAAENITYFVHDDYLQILIELGLPGLAALLAVVVLPFWLAARSEEKARDKALIYVPLAGVATMAIHALGDFPFYVPVCLLMFGILLGEVDAQLGAGRMSATKTRGIARRVAALAGGALLAVLLVAPALAEAAAAYGDRSWRAAKPEAAAYGFELARRLQPRDWRYHWYAGQFWYAQAVAGNVRAAPLADRAFAAAVAANPREPRPLLARLGTQMRFARMLNDRQPPATLRDWAERALALAPLNPAVRRDCAAALQQLSGLQ